MWTRSVHTPKRHGIRAATLETPPCSDLHTERSTTRTGLSQLWGEFAGRAHMAPGTRQQSTSDHCLLFAQEENAQSTRRRKFQHAPYPHVQVDGESKSVTTFFLRYTKALGPAAGNFKRELHADGTGSAGVIKHHGQSMSPRTIIPQPSDGFGAWPTTTGAWRARTERSLACTCTRGDVGLQPPRTQPLAVVRPYGKGTPG